jgi:hypothetical protein
LSIPSELEADSVSIAAVETCTNIIEALKRNEFEELYEIIKNIMPDVTSDEDQAAFFDSDAQVTMFVPPRADVAGVLHAFKLGDLTAEEVRFFPSTVFSFHLCCFHTWLSLCCAAAFPFIALLKFPLLECIMAVHAEL